ncbi:MAG: hypothetical protein ABJB03_01715 [Rhodoglobus sp.]
MNRMRVVVKVGLAGLLLATLSGCQSAAPKPPDADKLSSSEVESIYEQDIATFRASLLSAYPDAVIPEASRVRFVDLQEWPIVFSDCMTSEGFEAHPSDDGGVKFGTIPEAQAEAQNIANFVCKVKYPVHPQLQVPLTDPQLAYLYWYFKNDLGPCLEKAGIEVPEAPSESVFVENYAVNGGWNIYKNAVKLTGDAWVEINDKCPQLPPALYPDMG